MNNLKFIKTLGEFEKPIFTINDAARILNTDHEYARLYLHRLKSKGVMLAVRETGLSKTVFPVACPFAVEQLLSEEYWPE